MLFQTLVVVDVVRIVYTVLDVRVKDFQEWYWLEDDGGFCLVCKSEGILMECCDMP